MKPKWYFAILPACITFGPLLMADMGGLGKNGTIDIVITLMGTLMLTIGLSCMFSMLMEQRKMIERIAKQLDEDPVTEP